MLLSSATARPTMVATVANDRMEVESMVLILYFDWGRRSENYEELVMKLVKRSFKTTSEFDVASTVGSNLNS